ncbi:MAG: SH3 domain-containing protein [Myxococcota bacterium]|nr:SH3 domain-containing protein [Myxococcota bacterium]
MSSPWRITRGDQQFTVKDVAQLKLMAVSGKIESSDLVQTPGGTEWLYATEVSELSGLLKAKVTSVDDDDLTMSKGNAGFWRLVTGLLTVAVLFTSFFGLYLMYTHRADPESTKLFGGVEGELKPREALATETAALLGQPDSSAQDLGVVPKDSRVQLIDRQGDFFKITTAAGETGWVGTTQVAPGYLFDQEAHSRWDPYFYPTTYLMVRPLSWTNRDEEDKPQTLTDMLYALENPTAFGVSNIVVEMVFLDGNEKQVDVIRFPVSEFLSPGEEHEMPPLELDLNSKEAMDDWVVRPRIIQARTVLPEKIAEAEAAWNAEQEAKRAAEAEAAQ